MRSTPFSALSRAVVASTVSAAALVLAACNRHADDPSPAPAVIVVPSPPAPDASAASAASAAAAAITSAPSSGLTGGTLTVLSGTAPASASTGSASDSTAATAPASDAGIAPNARLSTPGTIGPASSPDTDRPANLSPDHPSIAAPRN